MAERKKIKVLFFDHAPVMGGAEYSLMDILIGLAGGPIEPVLLTPSRGRLFSLAAGKGVRVLDFPWTAGILSVKRRELERNPFWMIIGLPEMFRAVWRIRSALRTDDYSAIYTNTMKSHILGGLAGKLAGVKVIWHFRDIPVQRLSRLAARIGGRLLPHTIIAVSRTVGEQFENDGKVKVIYNCPDIDKIDRLAGTSLPEEEKWPISAGNGPLIGIIGQISRWKGQDVFLRAAKLLVAKLPGARFIIVGEALFQEDDYKAELKEFVANNGLQGRVVFTGQLENVYPLFKRMDVLAHCSVEPEPFGRVLVEAMALGVPVVATRGGGVEEVIENGRDGLVVNPGDHRQLAEALEKLLADRPLRERLIENGRAKVRNKFNPQKMLERIVDAIGQTAVI